MKILTDRVNDKKMIRTGAGLFKSTECRLLHNYSNGVNSYEYYRVLPCTAQEDDFKAGCAIDMGDRIVPYDDASIFYCTSSKEFKYNSPFKMKKVSGTYVQFDPIFDVAVFVETKPSDTPLEDVLLICDSEEHMREVLRSKGLPVDEFRYDLGCGVYRRGTPVDPNEHFMTENDGSKLSTLTSHMLNRLSSTGYSLDQNSGIFKRVVQAYSSYSPTANLATLSDVIACTPYTFGVEFEISDWDLPIHKLKDVGIVVLKDGSTRSGAELSTIPMSGAKGITTLADACDLLSEHCKVDLSCSLHMNLGDFSSTKEQIVSLYMLYHRLQDEILDMMPYYLRDPVGIAGKSKIYADRLPSLNILSKYKDITLGDISDTYEDLYAYFTGAKLGEKPPKMVKKWDSCSRYLALNLYPLLLGEGRVEFRIHHPTLNRIRVLAWLIICSSIVRFAHTNVRQVFESISSRQKIMLEDVINTTISNEALRAYILAYIADCKMRGLHEIMEGHHESMGKGLRSLNAYYRKSAQEFLRQDNNYNFEYNDYTL